MPRRARASDGNICYEHLLTVLRYVERNALRGNLVATAEAWPYGSLFPPTGDSPSLLHPSPVPRGQDWVRHVNVPQTEAELAAIRRHIARGAPFGEQGWQRRIAKRLGLESALRPRGRPRSAPEK
jgi:putative transposase